MPFQYEIIASQYVRTEKTYACCPNEVYPHVKSSFQFKMKQMFQGDTLMTPWIENKCCIYLLWQYGLWSFQTGGTKLERFLSKNQHTQRKILNFENWVNGEVSKSTKIWLSKSIFYVKTHQNLSQFFLNTDLGANFFLIDIFDNII